MSSFLTSEDSPFVKALGLMYLRWTFDPKYIMEWVEDSLFDKDEVRLREKGSTLTIGELTKLLLTEAKFCEIFMPRWPAKEARKIAQKIEEYQHEIPVSKSAKAAKKQKKREEKRSTRYNSPDRRPSRQSPRSPSPENRKGRPFRFSKSPDRKPRTYRSRSPPRPHRSTKHGRRSPDSRGRKASRSPSPGEYTRSPSPQMKRLQLDQLKNKYGATTTSSSSSRPERGRSQTESDRILLGRGK